MSTDDFLHIYVANLYSMRVKDGLFLLPTFHMSENYCCRMEAKERR